MANGREVRPFDLARLWKPDIPPWEVALRAAIVYGFVQLVFRIAGRKELGRWGVPEVALLFLVTVATRKSIVADDESLTTAMVALATIVLLDRILSTLTARSRRVADAIEGPVRQLVRGGKIDREQMSRARLSEDELLARVRERGKERLEDVKDAFFERSGKITIVFRE
jgi:uncharacterized membrane protein YcaP (DUF421 family)